MAKKNELKPWRVKAWCIGKPSAQYVAKMEDVLDVYHRPYDAKRPVVCLDESSKELRDTPRGNLPIAPGRPERQDYEYARNGVCNLFMAVEPLQGRRRVRVTDRRTAQDFAEQLRVLVEEDYRDADVIVLVTDNLNTHTPACLYERFEPAQARRIASKLEWHYTPEHGSWLNIAESELSVLACQCLGRRIADKAILEQETAAWEARRNAACITVDWQFTTTDARITGLPATLSHSVMTALLRDELGYDGLLFTDALEMGALGASGYAVPVAAIMALRAGADMLLFNSGEALHRQAHAAVTAAIRDGELLRAQMAVALRRVETAKRRFGIL